MSSVSFAASKNDGACDGKVGPGRPFHQLNSSDADCLASAQMIDTGKGGLAGWV